jgi:hypothetical protein
VLAALSSSFTTIPRVSGSIMIYKGERVTSMRSTQLALINTTTANLKVVLDPDDETGLWPHVVRLRPPLLTLLVDAQAYLELGNTRIHSGIFNSLMLFTQLEQLDLTSAGACCAHNLNQIAIHLKNLR